jgi:hypothetical protein
VRYIIRSCCSVAEHAGLAEHAPHGDAAERSKLLAQEFGKGVAGNHSPPLVTAGRVQLPQERGDDVATDRTILFIAATPICRRPRAAQQRRV